MNLFDLENELKQQNIDSTIAPPGFSMDALFTTENKKFRYKQSVKHFTDMLLTGPNSLFNKIQYICKINGSRVFSSSNPLTIMMFLPENNVNERAEAYEKLLKTSQFHVININNKSLKLNEKKYDVEELPNENRRLSVQNLIDIALQRIRVFNTSSPLSEKERAIFRDNKLYRKEYEKKLVY